MKRIIGTKPPAPATISSQPESAPASFRADQASAPALSMPATDDAQSKRRLSSGLKSLITQQVNLKPVVGPTMANVKVAVDSVMEASMQGNAVAVQKAFRILMQASDFNQLDLSQLWAAHLGEACVCVLEYPAVAEQAWLYLQWFATRSSECRVSMYQIKSLPEKLAQGITERKKVVLEVVWSLSDVSSLAEPIAKLPGLVDTVISICSEREKSPLKEPALSILYNLSIVPEAREILLQNQGVVDSCLILMESREGSNPIFATMTLANLVGKDEKRSELLRNIQGQPLLGIVQILELHAERFEDDRVELFGSIMSMHEVLLPLTFLCIAPANRIFLGSSLLPLLPKLLEKAVKKADVASTAHLVVILSHFTFDSDSLGTLKSEAKLFELLESIIRDYKGKDAWAKCCHDAQGLLWTLEGRDQEVSDSAIKADQVMISYNWAHKATAIRVHSALASAGLTVWRDDDKIKENFMESMAQAVVESRAIIILVSPQYKESANCQREALFSSKRNKKLIPLLVVENYTGEGWLELLISPLMQYDISRNFDDVMKTVLDKELKRSAHIVRVPQSISHSTVHSAADVSRYLKGIPALSDLAEKFLDHEMDGEALKVFLQGWASGSIRFQDVQEWFGIKSVGKLMKLKKALDAYPL